MSLRYLLGTLLAVTTSLAFASPPPPDKPAAKPIQKGRPDVPAWHDRYDMPWEVVPAQLSFSDSETDAVLLRADAAGRKMAATWKIKAGPAYPYVAWNAGSYGYSRAYQGKWERGDDKIHHTIALSTQLVNSSSNAQGVELNATWQSKPGWKAALSYYRANAQPPHAFSLSFHHDTHLPKDKFGNPQVGLYLSPGSVQFSTHVPDNGNNAQFFVNSRGTEDGGHPELAHIARYWESAESFRKVALEELDKLEARARELIASGEAGSVWTPGGPGGGNPPMELPPDTPISEKARQTALQQALTEIGQRKQLVEQHYLEMHRAATAAFPSLIEVLGGEAQAKGALK
jgi:hypothetical protein